MPGVAATINDQKITMRELAEECIDRHGTDVLEGAVNRKLLDQALRKKNIKVGDAELEAEIGRAAACDGPGHRRRQAGHRNLDRAWSPRTKTSRARFTCATKSGRRWRSRSWSATSVKITEEDLQRGYEANYGPKVQCRAIVLNNQRRAQEVWEKARENPTVKNFGDLAEQYSIEPGSRSLRGEVPPIQKNGGQPLLEQEAFSLKPGELSGSDPGGYHLRDPVLRGLHQADQDHRSQRSRSCCTATSTRKRCGWPWRKAFDSIKDQSQIDNFITGSVKTPKRGRSGHGASMPVAQAAKSHRRQERRRRIANLWPLAAVANAAPPCASDWPFSSARRFGYSKGGQFPALAGAKSPPERARA